MKKIRLIIGMLVFVLGISNSSLSIFAAELDNENEQKIVSEIGGNLINSEDIPEGVIPIKFSNVEQIQKYLSLATEMTSEGKFLDLSPKIFNKLYDETNNIIDFSNYNITEADFTEPTFSNENIANVAVYSNTGVKSKKLSVTAGQSMTLYAKYTYANSKFKSITSVTSSYSGLTIGNKWKTSACITIQNTIAVPEQFVHGTGIGVKNIHAMMHQMHGLCQVNIESDTYSITLKFPVI